MLAGCQGPEPKSEPIKPIFAGGSSGEPQKRPDPVDVEKVETHDDIIAINDIWQQMPWLGDVDGQVVGFKVPVYFQSGTTGKGTFVPGTIRCRLNEIAHTAKGAQRLTLQTWELNDKEAFGFRVRRKAITGYYYGFRLRWSSDLKLSGRDIEIQFEYQRKDGRVVASAPKRFKVPLPSEVVPVESGPAK